MKRLPAQGGRNERAFVVEADAEPTVVADDATVVVARHETGPAADAERQNHGGRSDVQHVHHRQLVAQQ